MECPDGTSVGWSVGAGCELTGGVLEGAFTLENGDEMRELSCYEEISGDLRVPHNASLTALRLPSLASIGGGLYVQQNPTLALIELPALSQLEGLLVIRDNPRVCQSVVDAIVDRLRAAGWRGEASVSGNDGGC